MRKKIVFRNVDPDRYENCQLMPVGAVEAESRCHSDMSDPTLNEGSWSGPAMSWAGNFGSVRFPGVEIVACASDVAQKEFTLSVTCKNAVPSEILKYVAGNASDVPTAIRDEIHSVIEPLIREKVKDFIDASDKAGIFLGPFNIALRLRMPDGNVCALPSPRLLSVNTSSLNVGIVSARESDKRTLIDCVITVQPVKLCWRINDTGTLGTSGATLEVLATPPSSVWNSSGELGTPQTLTLGRSSAGTLTSEGKMTDLTTVRSSIRNLSVIRGWRFSGTPDPIESAISSAGAVWHRLGEIMLTTQGVGQWHLFNFPFGTSLSSIFKGTGSVLDFSASRYPVRGWVNTIGDRRVIVCPELAWPNPLPGLGMLPREYDQSGNETGCELIEGMIELADGRVLRASGEGRKISNPSSGILGQWRYPAVGVSRFVIIYREGAAESEQGFSFPMTDNTQEESSVVSGVASNLSSGELLSLRSRAVDWTEVADESELVMDIDKLGPGLASTDHRLKLGSSRPAGVARVLPGSSSVGYPNLYLFSSDGVRILRHTQSGGWRPDKIISGDKCLNPKGIVECRDSVCCLTDKGLSRFVNGVSTSISDPGTRGDEINNFSAILPGFGEMIGGTSEGQFDYQVMVNKGILRYDSYANRLGLFHNNVHIQYDLTYGRWISTPEGMDTSEWLLTYPMDIGITRIRSLQFFGCGQSGELNVILYGSDSLGGWRAIAAGTTRRGRLGPIVGSACDFWRLLITGGRPEGVWVS